MKKFTVSSPPHIVDNRASTRKIMLNVLIALLPCLIAAIYYFGWHVLLNCVICMATCFFAEILFNMLKNGDFSKTTFKKSDAWDGSSLVTGLILALNMPAKAVVKTWKLNVYKSGYSFDIVEKIGGNHANYVFLSFDTILLCIIGSIFAIMLVKMLLGGIGKNFANPAACARIFLLLSFGLGAMWATGKGMTAVTGATWLSGNKDTSVQSRFLMMFIGNRTSSAAGETCMIAIILGYLYLSIRKIIDFRLPLITLLSVAFFAFLFDGIGRDLSGARLINNIFANLMSGGIAFTAVFMATDYSTSPNTLLGKTIFAVLIGLFVMVIRRFTSMAEGASFALLIANIFVPLIDKYLYPHSFGHEWGKQISIKKRAMKIKWKTKKGEDKANG